MNDAPPYTLIDAGAIADYQHTFVSGQILLKDGEVLATGTQDSIHRYRQKNQLPDAAIRTIHWPDSLVLPAMVNCHAHLDLTELGPLPYEGKFTDWLKMVIERAPRDQASIDASVKRGIEMSLNQGVGYLGDIAASTDAARTRVEHGRLRGISYVEKFGFTMPRNEALDQYQSVEELQSELQGAAGIEIGIQPHSPYAASLAWFEVACEGHLPLSSHLAETQAELTFCDSGTGEFELFLKSLGKTLPKTPWQMHPVIKLAELLKRRPWLLAHCNYLSEAAINVLEDSMAAIAYCPIASDYFQHQNHPYQTLIAKGINVVLGSDSILCQSPDESQPLSMLSQMRHLYMRDEIAPELLLKMATYNGHRALGTQDATGMLQNPGGLIRIDFDKASDTPPLTQILESNEKISPVFWLNEL